MLHIIMIVKISIKRIPPVKHFENNCKEIWWLQKKIKENLIQIKDALLSIFTFNDSILIMVSLLSPNPSSAHQTLRGPQCTITAPTWSGSKAWMEKAPIRYFSSTWPAWTSSRPSLAMRTTANRNWLSTARSQGFQLPKVSNQSN